MFERVAELRRQREQLRALQRELAQETARRRTLAGRISNLWTQLAALNAQIAAGAGIVQSGQQARLEAQHHTLQAEKAACDAAIVALKQEISTLQTAILQAEAPLLRRGQRRSHNGAA